MGADDRQEEGCVTVPFDLISYLVGMTLETLEEWHVTNHKTMDLEICAAALCMATQALLADFALMRGQNGETMQ